MSTVGGAAGSALDILAKIVSDPDLYEKRLTELKEIQDAIGKASKTFADTQNKIEADKAALKKEQAQFRKTLNDFADKQDEVNGKASVFDVREAAVGKRESDVAAKEADLKTRSTAQEKWNADKLDELTKREAAVAKRESEAETAFAETTATQRVVNDKLRKLRELVQ